MKRIAASKRIETVSKLDSHLGYWLRYASNQVSHAFSLRVQACGVTVAEWVVLRELYDRDMMPSALAERLGMTRGAISKLADRLAAKNLAARSSDAEDRRVQALSLTPAGRALVPALAALADQNDEAFFAHLDRATRATIEAAMKEIVRRHGAMRVPLE
jgi:DNA-binding MarR family transcriptional regulator